MRTFSSDACIYHRDSDANEFIRAYFGRAESRTLWVGGAGFDPRSTYIPQLLRDAKAKVDGVLIREDRPRPSTKLLDQADGHETKLQSLFDNATRMEVSIFSEDETTVIGGREAVKKLNAMNLFVFTDILLDMSALSVGVSFPLARLLYDGAKEGLSFPNVHIMATTSTAADDAVTSELLDRYQMILGFSADSELDASMGKSRLWLPHLSHGKQRALQIIHDGIRPNETCPILPFPSESPRMVEQLIEDYAAEVRGAWAVDHRDYLYAAENDPLDLYRTILRIDTLRQHTYAASGGSVTVLSPLGSKVMAIGALMAALECPMPVVYVETQRYAVNGVQPAPSGVVHVWLSGSAYH